MNHREELLKLLGLLDEKILFLKGKKITEANPLVLFQLGKEIEEAETERQVLKQQIESLNCSTSSQNLYLALLKLGYKDQILAFRRFVRSQPIGAFLIHGCPDYGQRWLLNRLVTQHIDDGTSSKVLPIELHRIGRRIDISTLWRELGGRCGLRRQSTVADIKEEIVERVYQWWQTQNVVLIFHDVDCMPENYLQQLIQEFWLKLATQARETASPTRKYRLLMFLVDYEGCVGTRETLFVERIEPNWEGKIPVKLPVINPFCEDELNDWLDMVEMEFDELPLTEIISQKDDLVQKILENSDNGIPELAFSEICDRCECNWYEAKDRWLKL
jgi:inactive STAND